MTLPLTPLRLQRAYEFLAETPPFDRWNMPDSEEIVFQVSQDKTTFAWLTTKRRKQPVLTISGAVIGHTDSLMAAMAHEMVHLHQHRSGMAVSHGAAYKKLAAQVCRVHGFDPMAF